MIVKSVIPPGAVAKNMVDADKSVRIFMMKENPMVKPSSITISIITGAIIVFKLEMSCLRNLLAMINPEQICMIVLST
jgi:hypothetical protein